MDGLYCTHVKLLVMGLLKLTPSPTDSSSFVYKGEGLSCAETVGIMVTRDLKPQKLIKFTIDDGFGCIPCVLWLNQLNSPYFSRRRPSDVRLISQCRPNSPLVSNSAFLLESVVGSLVTEEPFRLRFLMLWWRGTPICRFCIGYIV